MYSIGEDQNELDWYINQKYSFDIIMYSLQACKNERTSHTSYGSFSSKFKVLTSDIKSCYSDVSDWRSLLSLHFIHQLG